MFPFRLFFFPSSLPRARYVSLFLFSPFIKWSLQSFSLSHCLRRARVDRMLNFSHSRALNCSRCDRRGAIALSSLTRLQRGFIRELLHAVRNCAKLVYHGVLISEMCATQRRTSYERCTLTTKLNTEINDFICHIFFNVDERAWF